MALSEDDRHALAARLATTAPAAADVVAAEIDDDEELREVLVDVQGEVVALTGRRVLYVGGEVTQWFPYDAVRVRRREEGLGIDALVEGEALVLEVARSTFVRLGVVAAGSPPGRATWLPLRAPVSRPQPEPVVSATDEAFGQGGSVGPREAPVDPPAPTPSALPPPGWHPDPSGRHWWRWWDGRGWTEHVADGGAPYVDPLPPR